MVGKITSDAILSASLAPVLMNESHPTYGMSRNDLMARVMNARGMGNYPQEEFKGSEAAEHGNELEGYIIKTAADRLGIDHFADIISITYDYENLFSVSLDGILFNKEGMTLKASDGIILMNGDDTMELEGDGVIEAKLTSAAYTEVPPPYRGPWQLQMQMLCKGASWGVIATLYQGTRLVLNVYQADPERQKLLIDAAHDFYQRIKGPDWYPAMDSADGARTWDKGEELPAIDLEPIAQVAMSYYEAKRAMKAADELAKKLEPQLMTHMGNHELAQLTDENGEVLFELKWPTRSFKAQPEKVTPAKEARVERQKSLSIPAKWINQ